MGTNELAARVLSWLGTYLLHSTLFLSAVGLAFRGRAHLRPRLAEKAWRFALLAGVLSASLQLSTGARPVLGNLFFTMSTVAWGADPGALQEPVPVVPAQPAFLPADLRPSQAEQVVPAGEVASAPENPSVSSARPRSTLREGTARRPGPSSSAPVTAPPASLPPPLVAERDASAAREPLPAEAQDEPGERGAGIGLVAQMRAIGALVLTSGWSVAALVGLALLAAGARRLHRRLDGRKRVDSGSLVELLRALEQRAGARRPVRLSLSRTTDSPLTVGWLRPEIVLPERALTRLAPRQLESMLAHELAHALRRDPLWFSAYALCERVLFFQPLNRLARSELHDAAELLCDDCAVRWTGQRLALASCLAEVAQWLVGPRRLPVPAMAARPSRLRRRIERLLDERASPRPERVPRGFLLGTGLALAACVLAVPGVSAAVARPARAPEPPDRNAPPARETVEVALPAPAASARGTEPAVEPADLLVEHARLAGDLTSIEREIDALSRELGRLELADHLAGVVDALRSKLAALRREEALLGQLLGQAFHNGTAHTSQVNDPTPRNP